MIFIAWIVFISGEQKTNLNHMKTFCNIVIPSEDSKILEYNQYQKSDKAPFIIYGDLVCLIEKIDGCINNPEKSSTEKVGKHISSAFFISTILSFKSIENKHDA